VAKKGLADMAVSNAFGSNIFDILLGLGFPWMMQVTAADWGSVLYVGSMNELNASFNLVRAALRDLNSDEVQRRGANDPARPAHRQLLDLAHRAELR
jgi:hypothetical protein